MLFSQPGKNIIAQSNGKLVHFMDLLPGGNTGGLIADHVAFLAKTVEALNLVGPPADREREALNGPIVMLLARRAKARDRRASYFFASRASSRSPPIRKIFSLFTTLDRKWCLAASLARKSAGG